LNKSDWLTSELLIKLDLGSLKSDFLHGFWIIGLTILSVNKSIPLIDDFIFLLGGLDFLSVQGSIIVVWVLELSSSNSHSMGSVDSDFITD